MIKNILVPTDGSPLSEKAATAAVDFAAETGASVLALAVAEYFPYPVGAEGGIVPDMTDYENAMRDTAARNADHVAALAKAKNVPCQVMVKSGFSAGDEIANAALESKCDLVWMGSHGRSGLDRMLMGSQTQKVLARAVVPVLVYPMKK